MVTGPARQRVTGRHEHGNPDGTGAGGSDRLMVLPRVDPPTRADQRHVMAVVLDHVPEAEWLDVGRLLLAEPRVSTTEAARATLAENRLIRAWAAANGEYCPQTGPVPWLTRERWEAAQAAERAPQR
jgi:hypothetical protein